MVFQDPYASLNSGMMACGIIAEPRTHKTLYIRAMTARCGCAVCLTGSGRVLGAGTKTRRSLRVASASSSASPAHWRSVRRTIICDEPARYWTLLVQAQVLNLLNELQQNSCILDIFISHDLSVVRHVADRVSVMIGWIINLETERTPIIPIILTLCGADEHM